MRTEKAILRKVKEWKNNPMLVSGVYRLFIYIPWESIPEEYKEFFPPEAKEKWNEDLTAIKGKEIILDIKAELQALLQVLSKKSVTHAIGLVPMIMADIFMYDKPTSNIQAELSKILNNYKTYIDVDRELAEQYSARALIDLIEQIVELLKLDLHFDISEVTKEIFKKYSKTSTITPELNVQIDKILEEHNDE